MSNLILGAINNYTYHDIEPWVVSLKRTGFKGDTCLVCYPNTSQETLKNLEEAGIYCAVVDTPPINHICSQRFYDYHRVLKQQNDIFGREHERVLFVDVKDVIFQRDPFDYPDLGLISDFLFTSEGVGYENEDWGKSNFIEAFGIETYQLVRDKEPLNCGVLIGNTQRMDALALNINKLSLINGVGRNSYSRFGGGFDQAAFNFITATGLIDWYETCDYALQCGTMCVEKFQPYLKSYVQQPILRDDGFYYGDTYSKYNIVHQYDRVPKFKEYVEKTFRE